MKKIELKTKLLSSLLKYKSIDIVKDKVKTIYSRYNKKLQEKYIILGDKILEKNILALDKLQKQLCNAKGIDLSKSESSIKKELNVLFKDYNSVYGRSSEDLDFIKSKVPYIKKMHEDPNSTIKTCSYHICDFVPICNIKKNNNKQYCVNDFIFRLEHLNIIDNSINVNKCNISYKNSNFKFNLEFSPKIEFNQKDNLIKISCCDDFSFDESCNLIIDFDIEYKYYDSTSSDKLEDKIYITKEQENEV